MHVLEGDWQPERLVVIEFESAEAAEAWYDSDDNMTLRDVVAHMDAPEFKAFWDADAQRVEAAVQSIGKVEG